MSSADAAAFLGITPRTLYGFIDAGELPAYRIGRVIRLQRHDVEAFVEACRIRPGTTSRHRMKVSPPNVARPAAHRPLASSNRPGARGGTLNSPNAMTRSHE